MEDVLRRRRRQNQSSQVLKTAAATTVAPTPAPMPAFSPVSSPWCIREPCVKLTVVADGVLLGKEDVDDKVDRMVGVYQWVDVMSVVMVLSPLEKTTTAVLVAMPLATDVTVVTTGVGAEDVAEVGALYTLEVSMLEVAMLEVADAAEEEVEGDGEDIVVEERADALSCDALDDAADPVDAVVELEAAEQATSKVNCTPLLAQFESNVAAAAGDSLVTTRCGR